MNLDMARSYKTSCELEELALVPTQIISPKDSSPIIGIVQDALLGSWMLTRDDMFINKFDMMNILMHYEEFLGKLPKPAKVENGMEYWTGKQLMSQILPDINYKVADVIISRGELTKGRFNKRIIGSGKTGNLIHVAWKDHGIWMTRDLINNIQRIANNYLLIQGHTMGIGDIVTRNTGTREKINSTLLEGYLKVHQKQKDIDEGVAVVSIGKTQEEQFENDANEIMNAAQGDAGLIAENDLDPTTNNLYQMAKGSQSKGGPPNIMQMMACVGQQNVMNERVPKKYGDRTLPHFQRFDDSPDARGFCKHSYMQGLNPTEFFFHAMSGRVGSIDTAIKSVTGDTPIIITDSTGCAKRVLIGDWIDQMLDNPENTGLVEHYEEREMELLNVEKFGFKIPTADSDGNVSWGEIKNITRHLPGKELFKIQTLGGRDVIVTESKSLLVWDSSVKKFLHTSTPLVKVGDFVPVTINLPNSEPVKMFLSKMILDNRDGKYQQQNDVALDPIISIEKVDIAKYPKVYDLTIPSTLNFGLANGLHVVDTAQSGYIARQLIKGHEDILVTQNMSVRNAMGNVIQWRYGDTGVTITEIERLPLKFFKESKKTMKELYAWTDDLLKETVGSRVHKQEINDPKIGPMTKQLIEDELTKLMNFYHLLHTRFFKYQTDDITVYAPVNIDRTITNYTMQYTGSGMIERDLSPRYIINEVDILCAELPKMFHYHKHSEFVAAERERRDKKVDRFDAQKYNESLVNLDHDQNAVLLFEIYLRSLLSSKRLISEFKISKFIFDKILERIRVAFNSAICNPGDMVGPQGSQSIAEPVTQLTLNTLKCEEKSILPSVRWINS